MNGQACGAHNNFAKGWELKCQHMCASLAQCCDPCKPFSLLSMPSVHALLYPLPPHYHSCCSYSKLFPKNYRPSLPSSSPRHTAKVEHVLERVLHQKACSDAHGGRQGGGAHALALQCALINACTREARFQYYLLLAVSQGGQFATPR